ncbi:MAG TPA: hypothetical protein VE891_13330, partial [Allosphingosinicella sp.]|nr:hypothetical protein [Allosphingosinicella sp.]
MIDGSDDYALWAAALFGAPSFLLLVFLVWRRGRDMADLRRRFEQVEEMLLDVAGRLRSGGAEASPGAGSAEAGPPARRGHRDPVAAEAPPR